MSLCDRWGLPHSILLGAPWPGPGDPLWTDLDVEKQLAYLAWQRAHCHRCGRDQALWLDADGKELKDPPEEVVAHLCPSCEVLEDWHEDRPKGGQHGIHPVWRQLPVSLPPASTDGAR